MRIRLALASLTALTLGVVACQPPEPTTYPFCAGLTYSATCIDVADPDAQVGWLIGEDGQTIGKINYWEDGTIELH